MSESYFISAFDTSIMDNVKLFALIGPGGWGKSGLSNYIAQQCGFKRYPWTDSSVDDTYRVCQNGVPQQTILFEMHHPTCADINGMLAYIAQSKNPQSKCAIHFISMAHWEQCKAQTGLVFDFYKSAAINNDASNMDPMLAQLNDDLGEHGFKETISGRNFFAIPLDTFPTPNSSQKAFVRKIADVAKQRI